MAINDQTGIVSNELASPRPADEYKAPEIKPIESQVDVPTETVESRLSDITAKGSRYTDLAKADAIRQANTRGLINTTMAGAAGTEAAIRAAMPIAQQDAKTFVDTRMMNQRAQNEFLRNRQSANLNLETAAQGSQLKQTEATQATDLAIQRDVSSAALNEQLASFESTLKQTEMTLDNELRTAFETTLQDERFSDEAKMSIVNNMNNIIRDTQEQITQVGLSDRTAAQQEAAINMIQKSRDAELAVYQDLLSSFNDWEWSTEFTPETPSGTTLNPYDFTYAG